MIRYVCHNCNDLLCETSVCKVCGNRTEIKESLVFYCKKCNAPSYTEECQLCGTTCNYVGTDLRPVFPEERLLLEATDLFFNFLHMEKTKRRIDRMIYKIKMFQISVRHVRRAFNPP